MSRTTKTEWSKPDGWHIGRRLERKARPAGRILKIVADELATLTDGEDDFDTEDIFALTIPERLDDWADYMETVS